MSKPCLIFFAPAPQLVYTRTKLQYLILNHLPIYRSRNTVARQDGPNCCMVFVVEEFGWYHPSKLFPVNRDDKGDGA
jgi:hypothetical protein